MLFSGHPGGKKHRAPRLMRWVVPGCQPIEGSVDKESAGCLSWKSPFVSCEQSGALVLVVGSLASCSVDTVITYLYFKKCPKASHLKIVALICIANHDPKYTNETSSLCRELQRWSTAKSRRARTPSCSAPGACPAPRPHHQAPEHRGRDTDSVVCW